MKEIQIPELLQLQLDILSSIDSYCRKKNIPYFLTGGTCIGAVRHQGYIPWDDDIDIGMTRPNYDRFIREYNEGLDKDKNLKVYAPELDWNYYAPYANICDTRTVLYEGANGHHGIEIGVKIDLFPIDGIPSSVKAFRREKKILNELWLALYHKRREKVDNDKEGLRNKFWSLFSYKAIQKMIRKIALSNKYEKSQYAIDVIFPWKRDVMCEREVYEDLIETRFENLNVFIMRNYDRYLSLKYGDYMKLPPEEQRVPHHGFKAYWKQ